MSLNDNHTPHTDFVKILITSMPQYVVVQPRSQALVCGLGMRHYKSLGMRLVQESGNEALQESGNEALQESGNEAGCCHAIIPLFVDSQ